MPERGHGRCRRHAAGAPPPDVSVRADQDAFGRFGPVGAAQLTADVEGIGVEDPSAFDRAREPVEREGGPVGVPTEQEQCAVAEWGVRGPVARAQATGLGIGAVGDVELQPFALQGRWAVPEGADPGAEHRVDELVREPEDASGDR